MTNAHVHDGFHKYREKDPSTRLSVSGAPGTRFIDISDAEVVGKDRDCDLTTLRVPRSVVNALGKQHAALRPWPQRRPEPGMLGFLIGYPGQTQVQYEEEFGLRPLVFGMPIVSLHFRVFRS